MNFKEWMDNADMPQRDLKGQWYDLETGLYFDPAAVPPIDERLPQHWGKRVAFEETKRGDVLITINNSALKLIGQAVITRSAFEQLRPKDHHEAVAWACHLCGFKMEDTPAPIRGTGTPAVVFIVDTPI